ncbi:MAG: hypothetical protein ABL958_02105 [Bdellovibrionia bacterium]
MSAKKAAAPSGGAHLKEAPKDSAVLFLIPSPKLGLLHDVTPEKISMKDNQWIALSRDVLQKRKIAAKNGWKETSEVSDDHHFLHSFGAEFCPVLKEGHSLGYVVKWPANLILRKDSKGWTIKSQGNPGFYGYHKMTSFPEAGESNVISVDLGWMVQTPPGWSVLVKNLPNNLTGLPGHLQFAEGAIRTDQAAVGIQVHAYIPSNAADEIKIKRGDPMAVLLPYIRENIEAVVMDDQDSITEATHLLERSQAAFTHAPGRYKMYYVDDTNYSPLYQTLFQRWKTKGK